MGVRSVGKVRGSAPAPAGAASRPALQASRGARAVLLGIALIGSIHALFMIGVEVVRLVGAQREIARLELEVEALEREAFDLQAVIQRGGDERYREQLARRQGFMYPDEVRVVTLEMP